MPAYMDREAEKKAMKQAEKDNPNRPVRAYSVRVKPGQALWLMEQWEKSSKPDGSLSSTIAEVIDKQRHLDQMGVAVILEPKPRQSVRDIADKMGVSPEDLCRRIILDNLGGYIELADESERTFAAVRKARSGR